MGARIDDVMAQIEDLDEADRAELLRRLQHREWAARVLAKRAASLAEYGSVEGEEFERLVRQYRGWE